MKPNGFTLVEMIVIMLIIGILISVSSMQFKQRTDKDRVESQVKAMYADLMTLRAQALYRKKGQSATVLIGPTGIPQFNIYSSYVTSVAYLSHKQLASVPISLNGTTANSSSIAINFDEQGVSVDSTLSPLAAPIAICLENKGAVFDSIVISPTQIQMGRLNSGAGCASANVVAR